MLASRLSQESWPDMNAPSTERLLALFRTMMRIRAFEDAAEAASQGGEPPALTPIPALIAWSPMLITRPGTALPFSSVGASLAAT